MGVTRRFNTLRRTSTGIARNYVQKLIPDSWLCCKRSERYHATQQAIKYLRQETDVVQIVQRLRYFDLALNKLLKKD